jgi:hypothetical protein
MRSVCLLDHQRLNAPAYANAAAALNARQGTRNLPLLLLPTCMAMPLPLLLLLLLLVVLLSTCV